METADLVSTCYTLKKAGCDSSISVHLRGNGVFYVKNVTEIPPYVTESLKGPDKKGGVPIPWRGDAPKAWSLACEVAGWVGDDI